MVKAYDDYDDDEDVVNTEKSMKTAIKMTEYSGNEENGRDWFDCVGARGTRCDGTPKITRDAEKAAKEEGAKKLKESENPPSKEEEESEPKTLEEKDAEAEKVKEAGEELKEAAKEEKKEEKKPASAA